MGRSGAGETPQSRDKRGEKQGKLNRRSRRWAQMTKFREARSRSSGGRAPSGKGETERPAKTKSWGVVGRGEFAAKQRKKRQAAKPQPELGHSPAKGRTWASEKEPNPSIRLPAIRLPMLAFQRCCARGHRGEQHVPLPQEFSSQAANNLDYCSAKGQRRNRNQRKGQETQGRKEQEDTLSSWRLCGLCRGATAGDP